jgi:hypothetical protein
LRCSELVFVSEVFTLAIARGSARNLRVGAEDVGLGVCGRKGYVRSGDAIVSLAVEGIG